MISWARALMPLYSSSGTISSVGGQRGPEAPNPTSHKATYLAFWGLHITLSR